MKNFDQYFGIPYKPLGYTKRGLDCYGLTRLILKEQFSISIPKQSQLIKKSLRTGEVGDHNLWVDGWSVVLIEELRVGDVLRMKALRMCDTGYEQLVSNHIGVIIEPKRVMHTGERTGVVVDRIDAVGFSWRCVRGYRYEN